MTVKPSASFEPTSCRPKLSPMGVSWFTKLAIGCSMTRDLKSLDCTCFVRKYAYIVLPSIRKSWSYSTLPFMSKVSFFETFVHA